MTEEHIFPSRDWTAIERLTVIHYLIDELRTAAYLNGTLEELHQSLTNTEVAQTRNLLGCMIALASKPENELELLRGDILRGMQPDFAVPALEREAGALFKTLQIPVSGKGRKWTASERLQTVHIFAIEVQTILIEVWPLVEEHRRRATLLVSLIELLTSSFTAVRLHAYETQIERQLSIISGNEDQPA